MPAMELCFVLAPRQNLFFVELVAAIRHELAAVGVASSVSEGAFPAPREDLVYVLVPPHEYFALSPGEDPSDELLARTIFISAEQPATTHFDDNVRLAPKAGAVFDISRFAIREYANHGIDAHHLPVGHSPLWDRFDADRERDIDILFLGCHTERRSRYLAAYASSLWRWKTQLLLSDNSAPNHRQSQSFVTGDEKWDLLNRSKVLINLHQGEAPYFEWLRMAQAMVNGAVVVSEHSVDTAPLAPGEHLILGAPENLHLLAQGVLEDDERRRRMQRDAHRALLEQLPLSRSVARLVEVAERVRHSPVPETSPPPMPAARQLSPVERTDEQPSYTPAPTTHDPDLSVVRAGLKDLRLDVVRLGRRLDSLGRKLRGQDSGIEVAAASRAYAASRPKVSVIVTVYNYSDHIGRALDSVAASQFRDLEIVVVDDDSSDDSVANVRAWVRRNPGVQALFLRHAANRGLPHARNTAVAFARAPLTFVLDADNEIYPHGLARLVERLDAEPDAALAYGFHERFTHAGPDQLMNLWPWQPERLRGGNYIDAMALVRTDVLRRTGGYTTDSRLHGWEDFELWCRLAELGERGAFVPEVVARYRSAQHSMLSLTNLSSTMAFSVLAERYPNLMGDLVPPR